MAMLLASWRMRPEVSLTTIMDRLTAGQSEAEVSAILGPPTADVTGRLPARFPSPSVGNRILEFTGERATAGVEFGPDGRLRPGLPDENSVIERPGTNSLPTESVVVTDFPGLLGGRIK